jgi:hypothetical protein
MSGARTFAELRALSTDELIQLHDVEAGSTQVGLAYFRDEISRRDLMEATASIADSTREVATQVRNLYGLSEAAERRAQQTEEHMTAMTADVVKFTKIIVVLTVINAVAAVVAALAAFAT